MQRKLLVIPLLTLAGCDFLSGDSMPSKADHEPTPYSPLQKFEDLNLPTDIDGLAVTGYHLLDRREINGAERQSYRVLIASTAERIYNGLSGQLAPAPAGVEIIDGDIIFGDLYPGSSNLSKTTISLSVAAGTDFSVANLGWRLFHDEVSITGTDFLPPGVQQRFEDLYLAGEFLPQFVLGDVNADGSVDDRDKQALAQIVESGNRSAASCAAAGDLTGEGLLDATDIEAFDALLKGEFVFAGTDIKIDLPLLYTQTALPCSLNNLFFAASPAVNAGEPASIFFLDPAIDMSAVVVEVLAGNVERTTNRLAWGLNFVPAATMQPGRPVILRIGIPGRGMFLYAFQILDAFTDQVLATTVNDDDGDDPTDTPPPVVYGEEDDADECPLRDDGCEVLLIDFFRHGAFYDKDMKTHELIEPQLKDIGCNLIAVYPSYLRAPIFGSLFTGGGSQNTYINNTNLTTFRGIESAIEKHAQNLSKGRALGIQIVLGHGDERGWGVSFAAPSGILGSNPTIGRAKLHGKVYAAEFDANDYRVCGNIALDFSCQAGYTPINIQTLNNTGSASRTPAAASNHTLHAGYDLDVGRGESLIGADDGSVREGVLADQVKKVSAALEAEKKARANENPDPPRYKRLRERLKDYAKSYLRGYTYYVDAGYNDDEFGHRERLP